MRASLSHRRGIVARVGMLGGIGIAAALGAGRLCEPPTRVPPPDFDSTAIACNADEAGERLLVSGRVIDASGNPIARASVTLYNTDATGLYNPANSPTRVPRIQATVHTDREGRFQILTVLPGAYPNSDDPRHIHVTTTAEGYELTWSTIWFEGDPRLTPKLRAEGSKDHITQIATPTRDKGVAMIEHEVRMREGDDD